MLKQVFLERIGWVLFYKHFFLKKKIFVILYSTLSNPNLTGWTKLDQEFESEVDSMQSMI
jgi:hypothetical protein